MNCKVYSIFLIKNKQDIYKFIYRKNKLIFLIDGVCLHEKLKIYKGDTLCKLNNFKFNTHELCQNNLPLLAVIILF